MRRGERPRTPGQQGARACAAAATHALGPHPSWDRLQEESERQQRASSARQSAEQRDLRSMSSEDVIAAAAAREQLRRKPSSGLGGRVIPRKTPPTSPTGAEAEALARAPRDFGMPDAPGGAASSAGAGLPLSSRQNSLSGGIADPGSLQALPDAPDALGAESSASSGRELASHGRGAVDAPTGGPSGGMSQSALDVLGAVSQEEYHGIVEYAAYLGTPAGWTRLPPPPRAF